MPLIQKTESFTFGGQYYATELEAVEAALREVGVSLIKEHSACMALGLIAKRDELIELLQGHKRLSGAEDTAPVAQEVTSGSPTTRETQQAYKNASGAMLFNAMELISSKGFLSVDEFLERAPVKHVHGLERILDLRDDGE